MRMGAIKHHTSLCANFENDKHCDEWTTEMKWHKKFIISFPDILKGFLILQKSQNSVYI